MALSNAKTTVKKSKHAWGQMMTVQHGNHFSIPLHPQHQQKIAAIKHGAKTRIETEDGNLWHVHRHLDTIHFSRPNKSKSETSIKRSEFFSTMKEDIKLTQEFLESAGYSQEEIDNIFETAEESFNDLVLHYGVSEEEAMDMITDAFQESFETEEQEPITSADRYASAITESVSRKKNMLF